MARIGRKGRLWLRSFHIMFSGAYIGAQIGSVIILFVAGSASDGSALHTYYATVSLLDLIIIPCVILSLITGLLLCWLTTWGFFKHGWVIYSGVAVIVAMVVGTIWLAPGKADLLTISETEGLAALQSPVYTSTWNTVTILSIFLQVITTAVIFTSALKPWRKREGAEATS
jgi:uncharacterized membrane protein